MSHFHQVAQILPKRPFTQRSIHYLAELHRRSHTVGFAQGALYAATEANPSNPMCPALFLERRFNPISARVRFSTT